MSLRGAWQLSNLYEQTILCLYNDQQKQLMALRRNTIVQN